MTDRSDYSDKTLGKAWVHENMKIGVSSYALTWSIGIAGQPQPDQPMDSAGLLGCAAAAGAEVLQIADNLPLHLLLPEERKALAAGAAARHIALEVGTKGLNPANLLQYLDISREIGAKLVRTLPHDDDDHPDMREALNRLRAVRSDFEQAGVMLAIENHDLYPASWLAALIEKTCSRQIGICLDAVNSLGRGESFAEVLDLLGRLAVNFHCKDYVIRRIPTMLGFDVTGSPAGEGMLDLKRAATILPDNNLSWIIESWTPWQGTIEATADLEMSWLKKGVANLTRFRESLKSADSACSQPE